MQGCLYFSPPPPIFNITILLLKIRPDLQTSYKRKEFSAILAQIAYFGLRRTALRDKRSKHQARPLETTSITTEEAR